MAALKAVLFDMDGVLIASEAVWRDALVAVVPEARRVAVHEAYGHCVGASGPAARAVLADVLSPDEMDGLMARWEAEVHLRLDGDLALRPTVMAVLDALDAAGVRFAVATSSERAVAEKLLSRFGILPRLAALVGGDEVEELKPAPDIYHKAAGLLGLTASDCAVFEDSNVGVRAGLAAGAHVIQVPDLQTPDAVPEGARYRVAETLLAGLQTLEF